MLKKLGIVVAVFVVLIAVLNRIGNAAHDGLPPVATTKSTPDPVADAQKNARTDYVSGLNKRYHYMGLEATAYDEDGELVISTDAAKSQFERDKFISRTFDAKTQASLCLIGFRTVRVKSASLFGAGNSYAMACKETPAEQAQRERSEVTERQAFASKLNDAIAQTPDMPKMTSTVQGTELVLTGEVLDPVHLQQNPLMGADQKAEACSVGFTAMRFRRSPNDRGTTIPYHCPKH